MASDKKRLLLLIAVVGIVIVGSSSNGVNALPLFSNHTGPTELTVSEFERLDSGCIDELRGYASSSMGGREITEVETIRTKSTDLNISVWTERTSSVEADTSTFRVRVDSEFGGTTKETCQTAVRYRITLEYADGSPEGVLPNAHGFRVLWLENGNYAGCSSSVTSPLKPECHRFTRDAQSNRIWRNVTDTST